MAWFIAPRNPIGLLHRVGAQRVHPTSVMSPEELEALHMYGMDPGQPPPISRIGKEYGPPVPETGVRHMGTLTPWSRVGRGGDPWYEKYNPPATTVFPDEYGDPQGLEDRTPAWQARRERHLGLLPVTKAPVEPHDQPGVIPPTVQAMTPEQARGLLRQAKLATPEQLEGLARRLRNKAWMKGAASLTPYEQQLSRALRVLQSGLTIKEPHWYGTTDVSDEPFRGQYLEAPPVFKDQPWVDEQYDIEGVDVPTATGPVQLSPEAAAERRQIRIPINTRAGPGTNFAPAQGGGYERATEPLVPPPPVAVGPTAEQQRIQELMKPPPPGTYDPAVPRDAAIPGTNVRPEEEWKRMLERLQDPVWPEEAAMQHQMYGAPPLPPDQLGLLGKIQGVVDGLSPPQSALGSALGQETSATDPRLHGDLPLYSPPDQLGLLGRIREVVGDVLGPRTVPTTTQPPVQTTTQPPVQTTTQPSVQTTTQPSVPTTTQPSVPTTTTSADQGAPAPLPDNFFGIFPGHVPPRVSGVPEQFGDPWDTKVSPGTEWSRGQGGEMRGGPPGQREDPKDPKEPQGLLGGILKSLSGYISERSDELGLLGAGLIAAGAPTTIPGKNQRDIFKAVQAYTEAVQKGDTEAIARRKAQIELVGLERQNTREALKLTSDQKAEDWWNNEANLTVAADRLGITTDEYRNLMSGLSVSERIKAHLENLEGPKPTFVQQKNNREITVNRDFVVKWVGTTGQERLAAALAAKDGKYKTIADVISRAIDEAHKSPFRDVLTEENPDYVPALAAALKKATRSITGLEDPNYQLWVARDWNTLAPSPAAPEAVSKPVPTADDQDPLARRRDQWFMEGRRLQNMPDGPDRDKAVAAWIAEEASVFGSER